jgi:REP element-mobilizing transposase RayT
MPSPGKRWRHLIVNTHCSWLHGDERGFRSRGHRIHSSGDYKNTSPQSEHAGLRRYHNDRSAAPAILPRTVFKIVGEAFVQSLQKGGHRVSAVSVNPTHAHALVELPDSVAVVKRVCGWCKYFGTRAIREVAPAFRDREIWSGGETYEPVDNPSHLRAAHNYILTKQGSDAWTWCHQTGAKW